MIDPIPSRQRPMAENPRTLDELAQARIDGHLTRRELIRRATALGFAAPVIASLLHATSDMAFGAPAARAEGGPVLVTGPTTPPGERKQGGIIVAGTADEPGGLDPWSMVLASDADIASVVLEGLLDYDALQTLQPRLATRFSIGADGLSYTFELREGVTFHNGDPFTANDVINMWQTYVNPPLGHQDALGWGAIQDMSADGGTLTVTLKEVFAPFLSMIGTAFICPASAFAAGAEEFQAQFSQSPVGTGPFRFSQWDDQAISFERYDDYWGGAANIEAIKFLVVPDDDTLLLQLQSGDIDLVGGGNTIPIMSVDRVLGFNGVTLLQHPTMSWAHIELKQWDFLRMTGVRQALDFATPTQEVIANLLKGRAEPCVADQVPGSWAWDGSIEPRPYDLDRARTLLAEAGLTPGPDGVLQGKVPTTDPQVGDGAVKPFVMTLYFEAGESGHQEICELIADSWGQIGVKTEVMGQDESVLWDVDGFQYTEAMTGCFFEWTSLNDPSDRAYWHSDQVPNTTGGAGVNTPAYFHSYSFQADIDRLTDAGDREPDQEKRKAIYFEIQRLLHEEVPVIFMYWPYAYPAVRNTIGGFHPNPYTSLTWNVNQWYIAS